MVNFANFAARFDKEVFYLAGFIENWGRGYEKIKDAFAKESLQVPTFEQVRGGVLATIQRERFVALNKQNGDDMSVIDRLNDQLTTGYIAKQLGMSYSTVQRILRTLKQKDIVYREGSDKKGYWQVVE